ncbi:hypothetical protein E2320_010765 [Naja naja]|nr:hypothetical protein E2320_010765 [Naja naja]
MVRALIVPQPLQMVSWDTLQEKLWEHYAPRPSGITCQHAFYHWNQVEANLSINIWRHSGWQPSLVNSVTWNGQTLMDRLVCSMRDLKLQWCLLAQPMLILWSVLEEAHTAESSAKLREEYNDRAAEFEEDGICPT